MNSWEDILLVDNPFISTPPLPGDEIIWAGMEKLKETLEQRLLSSLSTSPTVLVLNYGSWGVGKTHAARYFSQTKVLTSLNQSTKKSDPLSLLINLPRGSKDIIKDIYTEILDSIGLTQISNYLKSIRNKLGDEKFSDVVKTVLKGEEYLIALDLLSGVGRDPTQMELIERPSLRINLKRYFFGNANAKDLASLQISRNISSGSDMISMLSAIMNLLLYDRDVDPCFSEIVIWFDEMEDIVSLPGKEQNSLTSLIRDFTDLVPKNITIFINFTPRPGGKIEEVQAYLTPAVNSRIRQRIDFNAHFREGDITNYIKDIINDPKYRPEKYKNKLPDDAFPFDEDSLLLLSEKLKHNPVPRSINEVCSYIIETALSKMKISSVNRISPKFIGSIEDEIDNIIIGAES